MTMTPNDYAECKQLIEQLERENAELKKLVGQMRAALLRQCIGCANIDDYGDRRCCGERDIGRLIGAAEGGNR